MVLITDQTKTESQQWKPKQDHKYALAYNEPFHARLFRANHSGNPPQKARHNKPNEYGENCPRKTIIYIPSIHFFGDNHNKHPIL